jgi:hypothetical protein
VSSQERSGDSKRLSLAERGREVQQDQQDEARRSRKSQGVAGRGVDGVGRWSNKGRGALAQTKAGLTTFRLGTVSWLECGPLAALVCSLQRPNVGSASPKTR